MSDNDSLRPLPRPRLHEQVLERIRAYALESGLHAGDRLPAERELAQRLGVSRASVKQAVVVLEVQGLVEARHGGGVYLLRDTLEAEPVATLVRRRQVLPDVLDAREALESKLADLAARRRTDDDLAAMEHALATMRAEIGDGAHGVEGDRLFHTAVTAAARSALLAEFMREISAQIAESRNESLRQPGRPDRSLGQHQRILDAIRAADPDEAAAAMRDHVRTVAQVRLLSWDPAEMET
ncbi:FadR/GntR family transcriptional regulator [Streptomyces boninensis]|uniref:FadR/GntR family transcriptional regulator n=1 Tax=Streptomyces boninensis TaxID=2039455 RepID=UPI003B21135D